LLAIHWYPLPWDVPSIPCFPPSVCPEKEVAPESLAAIRHGADTVDTPGKPVDPALKLRIGDTVKLSLHCRTLFGESRKRLPVTAFTVVSASALTNKIVLLDKTGRTRYTFARDEFIAKTIAKTQKLERKLDRRQRREERYESMRY
jgi:hypothetical protein